jgi:hypothetical protein
MTLRDKAIKQLRKSIPIEPNEYTEARIQKLIKLWKHKKAVNKVMELHVNNKALLRSLGN